MGIDTNTGFDEIHGCQACDGNQSSRCHGINYKGWPYSPALRGVFKVGNAGRNRSKNKGDHDHFEQIDKYFS